MATFDETAMEYLRYFLGPTGIPDRLAAASQVVDAVSPVSGTLRSMEAAGEGRYLDSAVEAAGVVVPAGIAGYLARAGKAAAPYVAGAVDEGEAALRAMFGEPLAPPARPSAVIRRDDVFRGHGNMGLSYMEKRTLDDVAGKYAVRTTMDDQIEDMIASGLIRPKPEGYGKAQGSTIYMGLSDTPTVRVGPMEGMLSNSSRYALVGKADEIAKYDEAGGVPLDALQHIWYRQPDDTIVDILPEILRKNQDFGSQNFADGGSVSGAPNRMTAYRNARAAEEAPADENPNSILNLDPDQFSIALDELGLPPEQRAFLEEQYFAQRRPLPMTERPEGRRVGEILPMSFPEGMTGAEALMSGEWDWTTPEMVRGLYEAPAEAANVMNASVTGVPLTQQQIQEATSSMGEMMAGIGPATFAAKSAVRGLEMPDRSVVSMSGVRGMGDNGGPELEQFDENGFLRLDDIPAGPPRRYIHPETGLYSPSYEAAKSLPQEIGTPEQMRSMLLKAGAKEEELLYSGFDDWLKGKTGKVTKQEIEDVLGAAAAGKDGTPPYVRVSAAANAGITGVRGTSIGDLQDQLMEDLRRRAIDERDAQIESELLGRGYRPIRFADENEYRQVADRVRALYDDPSISLRHRPPARIMNTVTQVDNLLRRGQTFDDMEVQRYLSRLADDNDYVLGPSGIPEFTDEAIRRELPDFAQNPYYGSLPMRTNEEIADRVRNMSEQDLADELGVSVEDMLTNFDPGRSIYGSYVVPGMRNYSENQYMFDDTGRGVLSGIESLGVSPFSQRHFFAEKKPLMLFTLTGELNTPEGPAYHLAQLQSDIGQAYNEEPKQFVVPGTKLEFNPKPQDRAALTSYVKDGQSLMELKRRESEAYNRMLEGFMDEETGQWRRDTPEFESSRQEYIDARTAAQDLEEDLFNREEDLWPMLQDMTNMFGDVRTVSDARSFGGDYNFDRMADILAGNAKPKKGYGYVGKTAALPFATSTNRWLDAALKNELINAAKAGAEWVTIPKGDDVQSYTGGDIVGQRKFYGGPDERGIAPTRLKNLAQKLIPFETEFREIDATGYGPKSPTYKVFGMRLTPEIRKFLLEEGLPSFAKGGPVSGSSVDVDVFALD